MIEIIACLALLTGTFFIAIAALGLARMPDIYSRAHAVTKATTLGMAGVLSASIAVFGSPGAELLVMLFVVLTNPVGAHMIARSAYLNGIPMTEMSILDEMKRAGEHGSVDHDTD